MSSVSSQPRALMDLQTYHSDGTSLIPYRRESPTALRRDRGETFREVRVVTIFTASFTISIEIDDEEGSSLEGDADESATLASTGTRTSEMTYIVVFSETQEVIGVAETVSFGSADPEQISPTGTINSEVDTSHSQDPTSTTWHTAPTSPTHDQDRHYFIRRANPSQPLHVEDAEEPCDLRVPWEKTKKRIVDWIDTLPLRLSSSSLDLPARMLAEQSNAEENDNGDETHNLRGLGIRTSALHIPPRPTRPPPPPPIDLLTPPQTAENSPVTTKSDIAFLCGFLSARAPLAPVPLTSFTAQPSTPEMSLPEEYRERSEEKSGAKSKNGEEGIRIRGQFFKDGNTKDGDEKRETAEERRKKRVAAAARSIPLHVSNYQRELRLKLWKTTKTKDSEEE